MKFKMVLFAFILVIPMKLYCILQYYQYTEISWINEIYDIDKCKEWTEHAKIVQAEVSLLLLAFINLVLERGEGCFPRIFLQWHTLQNVVLFLIRSVLYVPTFSVERAFDLCLCVQVKDKIDVMIRSRFCQVTVPRLNVSNCCAFTYHSVYIVYKYQSFPRELSLSLSFLCLFPPIHRPMTINRLINSLVINLVRRCTLAVHSTWYKFLFVVVVIITQP